ncbi:MAG: PilZ domain-containing protein [Deltaproteobacteria bacterium]|nr:PilZ domain-containing protein [Deltaproteobacteria bacterium]
MNKVFRSNKEMRIHTLYLKSAADFFEMYRSDSGSVAFLTRAVFHNSEEIILELVFKDIGEKEHFRSTVYVQKHYSTGKFRISAMLQSGQNAKVAFIELLASGNTNWATKRNHSRHPVAIKAAWSLESPDLWHPCEITDIGNGGLQALGTATPPMGTKLLINFKLPSGGQTLSIRGEVVWVSPNDEKISRMGMKFIRQNIDESSMLARASIRRFLRLYKIHGNMNGIPNEAPNNSSDT